MRVLTDRILSSSVVDIAVDSWLSLLQRAAAVSFSSSSDLVVVSVSVVVFFDTLPAVSSFVAVVLDENQMQFQVVLLTNETIVPREFYPPSSSAVAVVGYSE